jgi:ATP-dependent Lon protease
LGTLFPLPASNPAWRRFLPLDLRDTMADKKLVVPETLAILPVRDTVLFPGAVLPLTVGR